MFAQAAQGGRRSKWDQPALDALTPFMTTPSTLLTQASSPRHGAGQFLSALRLPTAVVAPMLNVLPSSVNLNHGNFLPDVSLGAVSKPVDNRNDGSTAPAGALDAAAAAAARINAMLVAKGKLKAPPNVDNQAEKSRKDELIVAEVEINDIPIGCRNLLTKGQIQDEISKMSGAAVSTRGRYMSAEEKGLSANDRPLFLSIQGKTQESVDRAVTRIKEMIESTVTSTATSHFPLSSTDPAAFIPSSTVLPPPPSVPLMQPWMHYVQDKVFVGLEHMHPSFDVKAHVEGPEYSYMYHIVNETGAKVHLRGRGSGFMEQSSGREAFESLHIYISHSRPEGLSAARKLCENLLQTVHAECVAFQSRMVASSAPLPGYSPASLSIPGYGQMTQYYHPPGASLPVPYGPPSWPILSTPGYTQPYMQYYQPSPMPPSNQCNAVAPNVDGEIPNTESTQSTPSTRAATAVLQPQPQKRRFTEEEPEKDGSLLGYKHGPFHLTNAGAESSQCVMPPPATSTHAACQPDDKYNHGMTGLEASRNALISTPSPRSVSRLRPSHQTQPNKTQLLLFASETYTLRGSAEQSMTNVLPGTLAKSQHDMRIMQPFRHAERGEQSEIQCPSHFPLSTAPPNKTNCSSSSLLTPDIMPINHPPPGVACWHENTEGGASCLLASRRGPHRHFPRAPQPIVVKATETQP